MPRVENILRNATEVRLDLGEQVLVLRPLDSRAIRVRLAHADTPESPSLLLTEPVPTPPFELTETEETITVVTDAIRAQVDRTSGALQFLDGEGKELLAEAPDGRRLDPVRDSNGEVCFDVESTFVSPPGECLLGSGQFQDGYLNVRDLPRRLTQVNTQIAIPFLLSSRGYGLLWHHYGLTDLNPADRRIEMEPGDHRGPVQRVEVTTTEGTQIEERQDSDFVATFTVETPGRYALLYDVGRVMASRHYVEIDGEPVVDVTNYWLPPTTSWQMELTAGEHRVRVMGETRDHPLLFIRPSEDVTRLRGAQAEALDYVVIAGGGDEVIATHRRLTGPAPLMPIWAYGYIHCRERYKSQQELLENAHEFRRRKLPLDLIVQDWQYWGRYGWNAMRFDEADYPDPAAMVRELHDADMRLMVSVWSKVDPASDLGRAFEERGFMIPDTPWVDFFNPEAAAFYWEHFSRNLLSLGIDAWWQDATEPENDDLLGRTTHAGPGERMRLIYPLFVTKTVYEGQRRDAPDQRVCILSRSAFVGEQRYGAATWSGDVGHDWETLRRQIPAGLNYVATGLPYWTTDCGGFFRPGDGQFTDPAYHERFLRWLQYATFCPLQRVHGYQTDTEFWRYGTSLESQSRRWLDLRYRLLPYIYSEAARVTFDGSTLMRPLVMDFADDPRAVDQAHEFMFGPALLVSPVLEPGATRWEVYVPRHQGGWFDFWTGARHEGGQVIASDTPLERIPLHVPAGRILPLGPARQHTADGLIDPIELRLFPGRDADFTLYEDEGTNYRYERGECARIPMTWDDASSTLTIGSRVGQFSGMVERREFRVVLVRPGHGVGDQPTPVADIELTYVGDAVSVSLESSTS